MEFCFVAFDYDLRSMFAVCRQGYLLHLVVAAEIVHVFSGASGAKFPPTTAGNPAADPCGAGGRLPMSSKAGTSSRRKRKPKQASAFSRTGTRTRRTVRSLS